MSIVGIGTDIVKIKRIEVLLSRNGDKFAKRILSKSEWREYQKHSYPVRFLAKRFAAKEAASKALGIGIFNGVTFSQFEVYNNSFGKPLLRLFNNAAKLADSLGVISSHVTLSDEKFYAHAIVIFEKK